MNDYTKNLLTVIKSTVELVSTEGVPYTPPTLMDVYRYAFLVSSTISSESKEDDTINTRSYLDAYMWLSGRVDKDEPYWKSLLDSIHVLDKLQDGDYVNIKTKYVPYNLSSSDPTKTKYISHKSSNTQPITTAQLLNGLRTVFYKLSKKAQADVVIRVGRFLDNFLKLDSLLTEGIGEEGQQEYQDKQEERTSDDSACDSGTCDGTGDENNDTGDTEQHEPDEPGNNDKNDGGADTTDTSSSGDDSDSSHDTYGNDADTEQGEEGEIPPQSEENGEGSGTDNKNGGDGSTDSVDDRGSANTGGTDGVSNSGNPDKGQSRGEKRLDSSNIENTSTDDSSKTDSSADHEQTDGSFMGAGANSGSDTSYHKDNGDELNHALEYLAQQYNPRTNKKVIEVDPNRIDALLNARRHNKNIEELYDGVDDKEDDEKLSAVLQATAEGYVENKDIYSDNKWNAVEILNHAVTTNKLDDIAQLVERIAVVVGKIERSMFVGSTTGVRQTGTAVVGYRKGYFSNNLHPTDRTLLAVRDPGTLVRAAEGRLRVAYRNHPEPKNRGNIILLRDISTSMENINKESGISNHTMALSLEIAMYEYVRKQRQQGHMLDLISITFSDYMHSLDLFNKNTTKDDIVQHWSRFGGNTDTTAAMRRAVEILENMDEDKRSTYDIIMITDGIIPYGAVNTTALLLSYIEQYVRLFWIQIVGIDEYSRNSSSRDYIEYAKKKINPDIYLEVNDMTSGEDTIMKVLQQIKQADMRREKNVRVTL